MLFQKEFTKPRICEEESNTISTRKVRRVFNNFVFTKPETILTGFVFKVNRKLFHIL